MPPLAVKPSATGLALLVVLSAPAIAQPWNPPQPNPVEPVDYREWLNKTLGGGVQDNAAESYLEVASSLTPFEGDWDAVLSKPGADNPAAAKWLRENQKGLEQFRAATRRRACFLALQRSNEPVVPADRPNADVVNLRMAGSVHSVLLPYLSSFRTAAKGLVALAFRELHDGNEAGFRENVVAVLRFSHHLHGRSPQVVQTIVAKAIAGLAYDGMLRGLASARAPDSLAGALLRDLGGLEAELPATANPPQLDHVLARDVLQRVFAPGERAGDWRLVVPCLSLSLALQVSDESKRAELLKEGTSALSAAGYEATLREMDTAFAACQKWWEKPYDQAATESQKLEEGQTPLARFVRRAFVTPVTYARRVTERTRAHGRGTLLVLHLLAHRERTGTPPGSLSELRASGLATLQVDPFSGKDFVYRRQGSDFVLYSVGANVTDDGGKHASNWKSDDFVFWPPQGK